VGHRVRFWGHCDDREPTRLWQAFRVDVERAGLKVAIISAQETPGLVLTVTKSRGYNFVVKQSTAGDSRRESSNTPDEKSKGLYEPIGERNRCENHYQPATRTAGRQLPKCTECEDKYVQGDSL
jgi:hypothetical protein